MHPNLQILSDWICRANSSSVNLNAKNFMTEFLQECKAAITVVKSSVIGPAKEAHVPGSYPTKDVCLTAFYKVDSLRVFAITATAISGPMPQAEEF